jgi:hypothetical protein
MTIIAHGFYGHKVFDFNKTYKNTENKQTLSFLFSFHFSSHFSFHFSAVLIFVIVMIPNSIKL